MNDLIHDLILVAFIFTVGIAASQGYNYFYGHECSTQACSTRARIDGLWLPDIQYLKNYSGKYICINVDETSSIKELVNTCEHEVGHEVFARECAKNFTKCEEILEK